MDNNVPLTVISIGIKIKEFDAAFYQLQIAAAKYVEIEPVIAVVKVLQGYLNDEHQFINAMGNFCTESCILLFQIFPEMAGNQAQTLDDRIFAVRSYFKARPKDSVEFKYGRKITDYLDSIRYLRNCGQHPESSAALDNIDSFAAVAGVIQITKILIHFCDKKKAMKQQEDKKKEIKLKTENGNQNEHNGKKEEFVSPFIAKKSTQSKDPTSHLFVNFLDASIDQDSFCVMLMGHGELISGFVKEGHIRCGFANFKTLHDATNAKAALDNTIIGNVKMEISYKLCNFPTTCAGCKKP